jgi:hypothetical protein
MESIFCKENSTFFSEHLLKDVFWILRCENSGSQQCVFSRRPTLTDFVFTPLIYARIPIVEITGFRRNQHISSPTQASKYLVGFERYSPKMNRPSRRKADHENNEKQ